MKKILVVALFMIMGVIYGFANDEVTYTSGSFLVPVGNTDVNVTKEELTIKLCDDGFADVNVVYELTTKKKNRVVTMQTPFADTSLSLNGVSVKNNVSAGNAEGCSFTITLKKGKNTLHHTYRYKMSSQEGVKMYVPFNLSTASRWANKKVDDFTLKLLSEAPHDVFIEGKDFDGVSFSRDGSTENIYSFKSIYHKPYVYACLNNTVPLVWHKKDFVPKGEMAIYSDDLILEDHDYNLSAKVVETNDGRCYFFLGDMEDGYFVFGQDFGMIKKNEGTVKTIYAEQGQGFVVVKDRVTGSVNIRKQPTAKSPVIGKIKNEDGELPESLPCLGLLNVGSGVNFEQWFKVDVNGKTGYVRDDLMRWIAIPY